MTATAAQLEQRLHERLAPGTLEVIDSVGASVSIWISGVSASAPVLPAGSV